MMKVGQSEQSWIPVLATADADHPKDVCRLFLDLNRNGSFTDDGPGFTAVPTHREGSEEWRTSFSNVTLSLPGVGNSPEPFVSIASIVAALPKTALVGAGTVLTAADVDALAKAGGRLLVSPNIDADEAVRAGLIEAARENGMIARNGVTA